MESWRRYPECVQFYDQNKALYEEKHGEITAAADGLLQKAAYMERLICLARQDLESRGITERVWISSSRSNTRENSSMSAYAKLATQQGRLLAMLKLLPGNRSTAGRDDGSTEDELDDLDDC